VCLVLARRERIFISLTNMALVAEMLGWTFLKMRSFLVVQIAQHIKITISMKKVGFVSSDLIHCCKNI
jgi:hypothetical protein